MTSPKPIRSDVRMLLLAQEIIIDDAGPGYKMALQTLQNAILYLMHGRITDKRGVAHLWTLIEVSNSRRARR